MENCRAFYYQNNQLQVEQLAISALCQQIATPFYLYSHQAITDNIDRYQQAFAGLPIKICYAVKANPHQAILALMAQHGLGADVVSGGELTRAIKAGIKAENIVYSGVGKTKAEISLALEQGIYQFNVESVPELERINQVAKQLNKTAGIAFRINPDVDAKTHAKITTGKAENKFGVPISNALSFYQTAQRLSHIEIQGVDVHIGSQLTDIKPFEQALDKIITLIAQLNAQGISINSIDIGGGLGIQYHPDDKAADLKQYAAMVREKLAGLNATIIIEPGRSLIGNTGVLISQVNYIKQGENRHFAIIDAGMNDLIRPSLYDAYHHILPLKQDDKKTQHYDVVGPVCETSDTFASQRLLPSLQQYDYIALMCAGAYGATMANQYNSRPLPTEVMVKGSQYQVISQAPTLEQVIAREQVPNW